MALHEENIIGNVLWKKLNKAPFDLATICKARQLRPIRLQAENNVT